MAWYQWMAPVLLGLLLFARPYVSRPWMRVLVVCVICALLILSLVKIQEGAAPFVLTLVIAVLYLLIQFYVRREKQKVSPSQGSEAVEIIERANKQLRESMNSKTLPSISSFGKNVNDKWHIFYRSMDNAVDLLRDKKVLTPFQSEYYKKMIKSMHNSASEAEKKALRGQRQMHRRVYARDLLDTFDTLKMHAVSGAL
jgi:LytS/YehU family sensor histidine kinase